MIFVPGPCTDLAAMKRIYRIEWGNDLTVGNQEMDEDHRRFLSLANDLDSALTARTDKAEIQRLMSLIIEDAVRHFENEEKLFAQYGYPDALFHASVHAQIVGDLTKTKMQLDRADLGTEWIEKGFKIRYILMDHLLEHDMKYSDFVRDCPQTCC